MEKFKNTWFIKKALHLPEVQYMSEMDFILNISDILNSRNYGAYKAVNPDEKLNIQSKNEVVMEKNVE